MKLALYKYAIIIIIIIMPEFIYLIENLNSM